MKRYITIKDEGKIKIVDTEQETVVFSMREDDPQAEKLLKVIRFALENDIPFDFTVSAETKPCGDCCGWVCYEPVSRTYEVTFTI